MTTQKINIAGHDYEVACDDGQETHLKNLARALDARARTIRGAVGKQPSETSVLMLTALMLMDELQDTTGAVEQLRHDARYSSQSFEKNKKIEIENIMTSTIQDIAARIEAIAGQLERV